MKSRSSHATAATCLLGLAGVFPIVAAGQSPVRLTGKKWNIEIEPSTLSATGRFPEGAQFPVSLGVQGLGTATGVKSEGNHASWELLSARVHVDARVDEDRLVVEIVSSRPQKFTWPVIGADPRLSGVILPLAEGFYVPVHEKSWREFLLGQSPFQTMADLSMPLWGLDYGDRSLTYILTNPIDNSLLFDSKGDGLGMRLTHEFQRNSPDKRYGLMIVAGSASPIEPAQVFRKWLVETGQFVTLRQKLEKVPELEKLFGAAHVYLWADGVLDIDDVGNWQELLKTLLQPKDPRARRVVSLLPPETLGALRESPKDRFVSQYMQTQVVAGLNNVIRKRDLYESVLWPPASLPPAAQLLVEKGVAKLPDEELAKLNGRLLNLAFPRMLVDSSVFGAGVSPKMIHRLKDAGLDRLWLGVSDLDVLKFLPETVSVAKQVGYLFGPYDSYHSIHSPDAQQTWATAQFGQKLYNTGSIIQANGQQDRGFLGAGSHLSSVAAEAFVEKRVGAWMKEFGFNAYFVDCDATGELFDNYSLLYPATKQLDMQMRLKRLEWIRDTFHAVIGSEVGAFFAAPVIHFGHGMMTPAFGFRDPLLHDPKSPYFLGRWYPPGAPNVFFKRTVLPQKYRDIYFDTKHRLPLYQAAFHDSIITTHHWSAPSTKFRNVLAANELLELLYGVPPLYHLNLNALAQLKQEIQKHYSFFSPNYRTLALLPLSGFSWLTPDHEVQETKFGDEAVVVTNFSTHPYDYQGHAIPAVSLLLVWKKTGRVLTYTSQYATR